MPGLLLAVFPAPLPAGLPADGPPPPLLLLQPVAALPLAAFLRDIFFKDLKAKENYLSVRLKQNKESQGDNNKKTKISPEPEQGGIGRKFERRRSEIGTNPGSPVARGRRAP